LTAASDRSHRLWLTVFDRRANARSSSAELSSVISPLKAGRESSTPTRISLAANRESSL
jgi:hypothetical protein